MLLLGTYECDCISLIFLTNIEYLVVIDHCGVVQWLTRCLTNIVNQHWDVVSTWMGDCLRATKPSQYVTYVNSAMSVNRILTYIVGVKTGMCRVAGNTA